MSVARVSPQPLRRPTTRQWLLFLLQASLVVMIDLGNDVVRGNLWRPDAAEGLRNARRVAGFEMAHGFFVEPGLQTFFRHTHHVLGVVLTWPRIVLLSNNVYAFCHIFVTLWIAAWVFARHRRHFAFLRNVMALTNILALLGYELYPMAPPRLTTGLQYGGRAFHFQDTMRHIIGTGKLNGTPIGYNPLAAMPSLHVAWAIIMGATLFLLARNPVLRALGVIYPFVMTLTVVVTANHYVMDALAATLVACVAATLALGIEGMRRVWRARATPVVVEPGHQGLALEQHAP